MNDAFWLGWVLASKDEPEVPYHEKTELYNWSDIKFKAQEESILDNFYERHPELIRGNGDLGKRYPSKKAAIETLDYLVEYNAVTTEEYLTLFREILSF